jgi:hypothetical protein
MKRSSMLIFQSPVSRGAKAPVGFPEHGELRREQESFPDDFPPYRFMGAEGIDKMRLFHKLKSEEKI